DGLYGGGGPGRKVGRQRAVEPMKPAPEARGRGGSGRTRPDRDLEVAADRGGPGLEERDRGVAARALGLSDRLLGAAKFFRHLALRELSSLARLAQEISGENVLPRRELPPTLESLPLRIISRARAFDAGRQRRKRSANPGTIDLQVVFCAHAVKASLLRISSKHFISPKPISFPSPLQPGRGTRLRCGLGLRLGGGGRGGGAGGGCGWRR